MTQRLGLFASVLGSSLIGGFSAHATCEVKGVINGVTGQGAVIERSGRILIPTAGTRLCAGDELKTGSSGVVHYETVDGASRVIGSRQVVSFAEHEGQADSALDTDDFKDDPHEN